MVVRAQHIGIWILVILTSLSLGLSHRAVAKIPNAFNTTRQIASSDLSAFTKWTAVLPRYEAAKKEMDERCEENPDDCPASAWEDMLKELHNRPLKAKLDGVNRFFNAVTYLEDANNWGSVDYWATPYEMMERGADCEDYAIAKYISLKRLGVPESTMRIMIVQDHNLGGIMHAVLQVTVNKTRYLLDNQATSVTTVNEIYHYQPIYAINEQQWWAYQ
jgi:predicted transglutaminase-like cysteine proteinase